MGLAPPETRPPLDPYTPERGDASYRVEHYDLDLDYKVAPNRLSGTATLTVRALEPVTSLRLDLVGLPATKVAVDGRPAKWTTRPQSLLVRLARPLFTGATATVRIAYGGTPSPTTTRWGTLGWEELDEGALVASQPTGAPTWFPCNDHPRSKATYRVSFECDSPYDVAVTGRLVSSRVRGSRTKRVFEQPHPTATYLMSVHVGHWTAHRIGEQPCPVWVLVPPQCTTAALHDLGRLPQMVAVLSELVGPYPFEDYTVVVTPDALDIPLEAQAMATFGANWLPGDRRHERLVAHELAHQWFGNSLTLGSWRDIWLHEGFACYAEWLWSQASGGWSTERHAREHHRRLALEPQRLVVGDPGPDAMFDDAVYKRGALTLHALRRLLGDPAFFGLLRTWVAEHADGTVTTADFVAAAAAAGTRARVGQDAVRRLLAAWLDQAPLPDLL